MKTNILHMSYLYRVALVVCLMVLGAGNAWGTDYTYDMHTSTASSGGAVTNWYSNSTCTTHYSKTTTGTNNLIVSAGGSTTMYYKDATIAATAFGVYAQTKAHFTSSSTSATSFFMGQKDSYITLPTYTDQVITNVKIATGSGCAKDVDVNVYSSSTAASTQLKTVSGKQNLNFAIGSSYQATTLKIQILNAKNLQIDTIVITTASACDKKVTVSDGSSSTNGSITSITTSPVATCSSTASDRRVSIIVTPSTGYVAPEALSVGTSTGTVTSTKVSRTDNGNGTFTFVYGYNQNDNGTISYNAACVGKQCTVTFDKNSGTGGDKSVTATYGSAMTAITPPTRDHYDFGGYYDSETSDNGTGNKYYNADGTSAATWNKNTTSNTTLYAKWTEHSVTNYRTKCCDILDAIDGEATLTQGGNSVTISGWSNVSNVGTYTVKMYKKNGASWDLVSGSAANGDAGTAGTRTGITSVSKSVTYTGLEVESEYKFTIQAIAGSSAYCNGAETDVTEINDIDVSSTPFKFRYSIYIDNGSNSGWAHHYIEPTGNTDEGSVDIDLGAHITSYQFKIAGGFSGWWGQTGTDNIPASTEWTLNGSNNVKLNTGAGGSYTFTVDYSSTNPAVTVTFPSADQDAGYVIYYDNSVLNWSNLYYRVGNNSSCSKVDVSLVPGTDKFYKVTTPDFDNMDAWHIANNYGWTGSNSIYRTKTSSEPAESPKAITNSISFQQYAVTEDITVIPTSTHSTGGDTGDGGNSNCEFYTINTPTSGMLTHNVSLNSPNHGTLLVTYTNTSGTTGQTVTEGNDADLAHRCILTITATPDDGYTCTSLTVNSSNFTSGNTHILSADAVVEATFTAQTSTVTLKPNGGSGSDQTVLATYDANMPLVTTADKTPAISVPSRDHYSFTGYFDNTSGGTQYYTYTSSTLASARTWDKTGAQNLYAQWLGDLYTITYKDKGDVSFSGEHVDGYPTNHRYGTATTLESATKTGYTFDGWFDESTCSGDALASVGATAYTDNFTLYGSWTPKTTTITLDMQSGSDGTEEVTATYDANTNLTSAITKPTRSNYVFKGYYSATSGGGVQVIDADGNWLASVSGYTGAGKIWQNDNASVTLYAYWAPCYAVTWNVNGAALSGDDLGSAPSSVETGTKPGNVPPAPVNNRLNNCANKFMGWSTHSWGSTTGKDDSDYDDLFTDAGDAPTISAATDFYAVFAERDGVADVDDVMWSETWTGASTSTSAGDSYTPSANYGKGTSVYGGATLTYTQNSNGTYCRAENTGGGSSPELILKGGDWWNIANIPTGGATKLTLIYYSNNDANVTTTTDKVAIGSTSTDGKKRTRTITISGSVSSFDLKFANASNTRIDNVTLKVTSVSYSNYVTECTDDQVRVTYNFNGGSGTACTQGVTKKDDDYEICSTTPTKTGYTFLGWSDGTNTYNPEATYDLQATTEFTASWEAKQYTITYKDEGDVAYSGTNSGSLVGTHTYGTPTDLVDGDKGVYYRFDGWFTESTCAGDPITSIAEDDITTDITLYAKWTRLRAVTWTVNKVANVTYVEDGSALTFPDDPDAPSACSATKEFVGWITSEIEDETDAVPAFISAGGAVNADATYHAVFAHALGTSISATEVTSFTTSGLESYCGSSNGMKDNGDYILKNSLWSSSDMANVKVKIKVYHVSNKSADVLRISLIDKDGAEVVGTDLSTTIFATNISSAAYSEYVTLTPTSAVTGFKVAMKTKNSGGTCVDKVTYEVVSDYEAYATFCCGDKIEAPDVTATKLATAADASTVTLSWDAVTDATGYKVRWGVDGEWEDNGTSRTYVKAGLAPDTYTWYVKAKYDEEDNCGAEIEKGSTTVNTAYSVTYDANTTGYTGDVPAISWYEPSLSVTVSTNVLAKSRYHWDGWTPYNASTDAEITVTTGAFTMPSANVTVKGGWTEVLSGDEVYITSAKDITTMSSMSIGVTRATYKSGTMTISNQTGGQGGTFHAVITGATADATDGLNATVKIEYTPSKANVTESAMMTAVIGSESYNFTVYGRSLPTDFIVVAKAGGSWTALPADETTSALLTGYSVTLDDVADPTKATIAPSGAIFNYYAHVDKAADYIRLAGKSNSLALWSSTSNDIKVYAAIDKGSAHGNQYEWKLATNDNETYTLHNDAANSGSGRDLGVNSDKKWGMHASAVTNSLRFLPVDATADYIHIIVTAWNSTSFTFTTVEAIPSHDHVAVECNGDSYSATMTGSSTYTLSITGINFANYAGAPLIVQWQDGSNAVLAQGSVMLPIFITSANTDFSGYDSDILSSTDVHVINGSTLTITGNVSVHDMTIEGGSTLNVSTTGTGAAVTFGVNTLYLRGGWSKVGGEDVYDMPRVYIDPKSSLTKTQNAVNFDISVDSRNYYPFAVPFPVTVSAVDYANATLAGASTYGTHYVIKEYDEASRSENGAIDANWKVVEDGTVFGISSATLQPGKGYILTAVSVPAYGGGVIRFPMSFTNTWTAKGEQASVKVEEVTTTKNQIAVTAHSGATAASSNLRHAGWNMLGVPYMSCFASNDNVSHNEGASAFITGKMELTDDPADPYGGYDDGVVYVTVPTHDFSEYLQYDITDGDTKLLPGWSFFVQFAKDGTLTFANTGQTNSSSLPIYAPQRTMDSTMTRIKTGVILSTADGETSDKFGLIISDRYTQDYEVGADLEKMFGNGYTLATYSLSQGTRLAFNALSTTEAAQVIPVGYRAPEAGQYTFAINPRYATEGLLRVELIDYQTGDLTDLLTSTYTFTTSRTQDDTRFAIHVTYTDPNSEMPTGEAPPIETGETLTRKFILNGQLYIQRGTVIYDATGKEVRL